ncbi:bacteriohemerythrin [Varunaivibrio sulfuroxidans]|uniref:Hemerythrin-like metal-binding protein n=1 Tax=Varunaivibrio sulfuroxidans TaxID=1773489 RepID=A0A4R3J799_9PROT|nr:hemerythrin family protein [Varunaivibrio sulfuroxidans]TCS61738.1 hemerythrin-like metal-binding protein [Varunaivibrio sulfuroxidans]WES32077.1 hemerythrin family protein [Varunaivibrio sulfuroxidans]
MADIEWNDETHALGIAPIDADHRAVIAALNDARNASTNAFAEAFRTLAAVTCAHFQNEEALMTKCGLDDNEHRGEHRRVLGEMEMLLARAEKGRARIARAFVAERMGAWLDIHIQTLDSALAAHLARTGFTTEDTPATAPPDGAPDRRTPGAPPGPGA